MSVKDKVIEWIVMKKINQLIKEGKMNKILEFLKENKNYVTAAAVGVCAALQYLGVSIPTWVLTALAAFGITIADSSIKTQVMKLSRRQD